MSTSAVNFTFKIGLFVGRIRRSVYSVAGYCGERPFAIGDEFIESREAPTQEQLSELLRTGHINLESRKASRISARVLKIIIYGNEVEAASPGIKCELHLQVKRGRVADFGELVSLVGTRFRNESRGDGK